MAQGDLTVQLQADIQNFTANMQKAVQHLSKVSESTKKTSQATTQMAQGFSNAGTAIKAFVGLQILGQVKNLGTFIASTVETSRSLEASFKALTGSGADAQQMLASVRSIAAETGLGFKEVGDITQRLTIGLKALGASQNQITGITDTVIKLGAIGGTNMQDIAGAAQQLGQALASGRLAGDELRSIMERMPLLGQAIAKELGVAVGELKKMGEEGKLSSADVANAILKSAQYVNTEFAKLPVTMDRAFGQIKASFEGALDTKQARDSMSGLASALQSFASVASTTGRSLSFFFSDVVRLGTSILTTFREMGDGARTFVTAVAGVAAVVAPIPTAIIAIAATVLTQWDKVSAFIHTTIIPAFEIVKGYFEALGVLADRVLGTISKNLYEQSSRVKALFYDMFYAKPGEETQGAVTALTGRTKELGDAAKEATDKINDGYRKAADGAKEFVRKTAEARQAIDDLDHASGGFFGPRPGVIKGPPGGGGADSLKTWVENLLRSADAARAYREDMEKLEKALKRGLITQDEYAQGAKKLKETLDAAGKKQDELAKNIDQWASKFGDAMFDAIANGKSFGDVLKGLITDIARMVFQLTVVRPLLAAFGIGGGDGKSLAAGPSIQGAGARGFSAPPVQSYAAVMQSARSVPSISSNDVNVGPVSITVNDSTGAVQASTDTGAALGDRIKQAVLMTIVQEKRPGGILAQGQR